MRATLKRLGKFIKDAWHVAGITLLLLCFLEASLSLAFRIKDRSRAPTDPRAAADTYSDPAWVQKYYAEAQERPGSLNTAGLEWHSYVYWRRKPFAGSYINIDGDGLRKTMLPEPSPTAPNPVMKVFVFGGSTIWGTGVDDAATIPSLLGKELQRQGTVARIVNFGETGYVSTQEVMALMLQLQKGQIPDVVIFYDGVNDTFSAYQQQMAGLPQNEFNRGREFNLSSPVAFKQRREMVFQDVLSRLATLRLARSVLQRMGLQRKAEVASNPLTLNQPERNSQSLAQAVITTYTNNIELVTALSKHYGFKTLFYWQPTIFYKTNLTKYERSQLDEMHPIEPFVRQTYDLMKQGALVAKHEPSFHDLTLMLSEVQQPIYLDWCHLGEAGNKLVAERMAQDVLEINSPSKPQTSER
jgi:lysophospholipase L1-like esterase